MGSLIYELEFGVRPEIMANDGELLLPSTHTGREDLDSLIGNAWHGQYNSTHEMLQHAIYLCDGENVYRSIENPLAKDGLLDRITQWRKNRENEYGNFALNIAILVTAANSVRQGAFCVMATIISALTSEYYANTRCSYAQLSTDWVHKDGT